jgi:transcriptional regulator with XRE-family HTH domain
MAETDVDALSLQVAHEVRAWMIRRNVRQETLANALGISQSAMSMRLRGRTRWTVNDLAAAASALEVPMSVLLTPPDEGGLGTK